jgi:TonB family protein
MNEKSGDRMGDRVAREMAGIPDDVRDLDEELSSIQYEERASFAPELRSELALLSAQESTKRPSSVRRYLIAATLAAVMVGGVSVPSARASFIRLIDVFSGDTDEVAAPASVTSGTITPEVTPEATSLEAPPERVASPQMVAENFDRSIVEDLPALVATATLIAPQMLDRDRAERSLQNAYPMYLQRDGIGGTVWLLLWVDAEGNAGVAKVVRSSGLDALDMAALKVAPSFTFGPALIDGRPTGTWIELPVMFEPYVTRVEGVLSSTRDPFFSPEAEVHERWIDSEDFDLGRLPDPGVARWEDESSRTADAVSDVHYRSATVIRDRWLASKDLGRVEVNETFAARCAGAGALTSTDGDFVTRERLIEWNQECPAELGELFRVAFQPAYRLSVGEWTSMMTSFHSAIEANPRQVEANTDLLLSLAAEGRWEELLGDARTFAWNSGGHPVGLLLGGVALLELDRSEEASAYLEAAVLRLGDDGRSIHEVSRRLALTETGLAPVEHLARAAYAYALFGGLFDDAAEVWVRFGRPDSVHIVEDGSGTRTEFWDYGSGPDITFVRRASSVALELTPEGRAYVDASEK